MNYEIIKYILIGLIIVINLIVFVKIKEKKILKVSMVTISFILISCLFCSKYQYYATDNVNRQNFMISSYNYNDDKTKVTIEYLDENEKTVTMELNADDVTINMSNGLGEVEKRDREYKKEILLFNKIQIPLGSNFEKDVDLIILNQMNFMTEEEINEYMDYLDEMYNESSTNEVTSDDTTSTVENTESSVEKN